MMNVLYITISVHCTHDTILGRSPNAFLELSMNDRTILYLVFG